MIKDDIDAVNMFDKLLNDAIALNEGNIDIACTALLGAYLRGTLHQVNDCYKARFELTLIVTEAILNFPHKEDSVNITN